MESGLNVGHEAVPATTAGAGLGAETRMLTGIGNPAATAISGQGRKRKLVVTIDVEALPRRRPANHVENLIWGRLDGAEIGIQRMMSIGSKRQCPLAFFVDLCEIPLYPDAFAPIAREIVTQGHDFQLHAHPDVLPSGFWRERGIPKYTQDLCQFELDQARSLFDFLLGATASWGVPRPVAFRGGAFRYNQAILIAMAENGINLGFNYKQLSVNQSQNAENLPSFRWSNGITELPLTMLPWQGRLQAFEFSATSGLQFSNLQSIYSYMNDYYQRLGDDAVLVLLMHSWSFLYMNRTTGYFEFKDEQLAEQFDAFLANLPQDVEVVSAADLARQVAQKSFVPARLRDVDLANFAKHGVVDQKPTGAS